MPATEAAANAAGLRKALFEGWLEPQLERQFITFLVPASADIFSHYLLAPDNAIVDPIIPTMPPPNRDGQR